MLPSAILLVLTISAGAYWLWSALSSNHPIVAVVRFDNETADPQMTRFSDGLTDNVVEQLTSRSNGRYMVVGNARILRLAREQRDLGALASSLHANYVVLGQVQRNNGHTRILAHLIRLPEQTHLWVSKLDLTLDDPLGAESEMAKKVADEFSPRVFTDSHGHPLPSLGSH